jgi:hypothetical protein
MPHERDREPNELREEAAYQDERPCCAKAHEHSFCEGGVETRRTRDQLRDHGEKHGKRE